MVLIQHCIQNYIPSLHSKIAIIHVISKMRFKVHFTIAFLIGNSDRQSKFWHHGGGGTMWTVVGEPADPSRGTGQAPQTNRFPKEKVRTPKASLVGEKSNKHRSCVKKVVKRANRLQSSKYWKTYNQNYRSLPAYSRKCSQTR